MTRTLKRSTWAVALAMLALFVVPDNVMGQRRSRPSRSRTPTRTKTTQRRSAPKPKAQARPKAQRPKASTPKAKASASKGSKADKALYEKAKRNGTSYKTRGEATKSFKSKMTSQKRADGQSKYSSKYTSKPANRPSHVPASTMSGGNTYNISYNQGYGGYGYMGALGAWVMYDAMSDRVMVNSMMRNQGYHYGAAPVYRTGPGVGTIFLYVCGIAAVVVIGVVITNRIRPSTLE